MKPRHKSKTIHDSLLIITNAQISTASGVRTRRKEDDYSRSFTKGNTNGLRYSPQMIHVSEVPLKSHYFSSPNHASTPRYVWWKFRPGQHCDWKREDKSERRRRESMVYATLKLPSIVSRRNSDRAGGAASGAISKKRPAGYREPTWPNRTKTARAPRIGK